jgi:hypothetical protein
MFTLTGVVPDFNQPLQRNTEYMESHGEVGKICASKSG